MGLQPPDGKFWADAHTLDVIAIALAESLRQFGVFFSPPAVQPLLELVEDDHWRKSMVLNASQLNVPAVQVFPERLVL